MPGAARCSRLQSAGPGGVQRLTEDAAWQPERLAREIQARGEETLFVGNGALVYREKLTAARAEFASQSSLPDGGGPGRARHPPVHPRGHRPAPRAATALCTQDGRGDRLGRQGVVILRPDRVKIAKKNPSEAPTVGTGRRTDGARAGGSTPLPRPGRALADAAPSRARRARDRARRLPAAVERRAVLPRACAAQHASLPGRAPGQVAGRDTAG